MNKIEVISASNAEKLEIYGPQLTETYKVAFAGEPWFEVSKCAEEQCAVGFTPLEAGGCCESCEQELVEAYSTEELLAGWKRILEDEGGFMEVALTDEYPQRATLARPTTPDELFERKYQDVPAMEEFLARVLPKDFVWIEDTFANRQRQPNGNLKNRKETFERIGEFYGRPTLATRTLSEAIVASTVKCEKARLATYLGSARAGALTIATAFKNPGYSLPTAPDRRTLLVVKNSQTQQ